MLRPLRASLALRTLQLGAVVAELGHLAGSRALGDAASRLFDLAFALQPSPPVAPLRDLTTPIHCGPCGACSGVACHREN